MKETRRNVYGPDRVTVLGTVSSRATSIGASKVAGGKPTQFSSVNGTYGWVVTSKRAV